MDTKRSQENVSTPLNRWTLSGTSPCSSLQRPKSRSSRQQLQKLYTFHGIYPLGRNFLSYRLRRTALVFRKRKNQIYFLTIWVCLHGIFKTNKKRIIYEEQSRAVYISRINRADGIYPTITWRTNTSGQTGWESLTSPTLSFHRILVYSPAKRLLLRASVPKRLRNNWKMLHAKYFRILCSIAVLASMALFARTFRKHFRISAPVFTVKLNNP